MSGQWVVLLSTGKNETIAYGPMNAVDAGDFTAYLNAEVDPAKRVPLRSPASELLGYWRNNRAELERNACSCPMWDDAGSGMTRGLDPNCEIHGGQSAATDPNRSAV